MPVDIGCYVEQEGRIAAATAESRRLRVEHRREFRPGYLYVVQFDSGVVKVGRADNAATRLAAHAKTGLIRSSWSSPRHPRCDETERRLIAFCNEHGTLYGGREYFRDIQFEHARAYAALVVQNALRDAYLKQLVEAVDGDMSATWEQAERALRGS